jgi:hypothetical protein
MHCNKVLISHETIISTYFEANKYEKQTTHPHKGSRNTYELGSAGERI